MPSRSAWLAADEPTIPVWDRVVLLFHWSTVSLVLVAFFTTDDARWLHEATGYAVLALLALRIIWGIIGTRHALFVSFLAGPRAVLRYVLLLYEGRAPRYVGHNPAGGAMIAVLLVLLGIVAGSGWLSETDTYFGVPWVDHLHHISAHLLLVLIGLHLAGVFVSSWLHQENLVLAMITGRKPARSAERSEFQLERAAAAVARHDLH
jgi:cytochrome b